MVCFYFLFFQEKDDKDKNGEESTVEKSEKESSEKMEEEEPDFELLENPARVLPAQVSKISEVYPKKSEVDPKTSVGCET